MAIAAVRSEQSSSQLERWSWRRTVKTGTPDTSSAGSLRQNSPASLRRPSLTPVSTGPTKIEDSSSTGSLRQASPASLRRPSASSIPTRHEDTSSPGSLHQSSPVLLRRPSATPTSSAPARHEDKQDISSASSLRHNSPASLRRPGESLTPGSSVQARRFPNCELPGGQGSARVQSFLTGVSWDAEVENARTGHGLDVLLRHELHDEAEVPMQREVAEPSSAGIGAVDEQGFVRTSDLLSSSIDALRGRHLAFEGVLLASADGYGVVREAAPSGGAQRRQASPGMRTGREEDANLAERLQVYKYYRKFDREREDTLDPAVNLVLKRNASCPSSRRPPKAGRQILKYNASDEAMQNWFPEARKRLASSRGAARRHRTEEASAVRQQQLLASSVRWTKDLQRKREQGEIALANRRHWGPPGSGLSPRQPSRDAQVAVTADTGMQSSLRVALAENWLSWLIVASMMQVLRTAVTVGHRSMEEQYTLLMQLPSSLRWSLLRTEPGHKALQLHQLLEDAQPYSSRLLAMAKSFQTVLRVRLMRRNAATILCCMQHWCVAGRTFVAMRRYAKRIELLQRWWRSCSLHMRTIRDSLAVRWERLEKAELALEEQKRQEADPRIPMGNMRRQALGLVSMKPEDRLRFLENELRARRAMVLPLLYIWEEDVRKWRKELQEWHDTCAAHKALGIAEETAFRWPPTRPSYLPPSHPQHDRRGLGCPEECPGRRGDRELIEMWRTARKNRGFGWQRIPLRKAMRGKPALRLGPLCSNVTRAKSENGKMADRRISVAQRASPFGDVATDEELRQWGINAEAWPCLS